MKYTGHQDAWTLANILHRDISCGNILIEDYVNDEGQPETRGFLNDWTCANINHNCRNLREKAKDL